LATILYVDDNSRRLEAMVARLELAGYHVLAAKNGSAALEIFAKQHIDAAVVDYYMNGMGGDIVALEMKRLRSHMPIIVFSGTFTLPEMVIALVDGFVHVGEDSERLINKIAEVLKHKRQVEDEDKGAA
jgi:DNA-binding NtrC family response regulator